MRKHRNAQMLCKVAITMGTLYDDEPFHRVLFRANHMMTRSTPVKAVRRMSIWSKSSR